MERKSDTHTTIHYHANRFYRINGEWYYSTREGEDFGPFTMQDSAQKSLAKYLADREAVTCGNYAVRVG